MRQADEGIAGRAGRLLANLCKSCSEPEVGYRIQGIAAHILLNTGARIVDIRNQGHPDIIASDSHGSIRVEVEADLGSGRMRLPSSEDLESVRPLEKGDRGYFALAECSIYPRWHVVPAERLRLRHVEIGPTVLGAIADEQVSRIWTREFSELLVRNESRLPGLTYDRLRTLALDSHPV